MEQAYPNPISSFLQVVSRSNDSKVEKVEKTKLKAIAQCLKEELNENQEGVISKWMCESYFNEDEVDQDTPLDDILKMVISKTPHPMIESTTTISQEEEKAILSDDDFTETFVEIFGDNPRYTTALMKTDWCRYRYESNSGENVLISKVLGCMMYKNFFFIKSLRFGTEETGVDEKEKLLYFQGIKDNTIVTTNFLGFGKLCIEFLSIHAPWWGKVPNANISGSIIPAIVNPESKKMYSPTYFDLKGEKLEKLREVIISSKREGVEVVGFFFPCADGTSVYIPIDDEYDKPPVSPIGPINKPVAVVKYSFCNEVRSLSRIVPSPSVYVPGASNETSQIPPLNQTNWYGNEDDISPSSSDSEDSVNSDDDGMSSVEYKITNDTPDSDLDDIQLPPIPSSLSTQLPPKSFQPTFTDEFVLVDIIPGTDIDCPVWKEEDVEQVAVGISKNMCPKYPSSVKIEKVDRSKGVAYSVSMDCTVPQHLCTKEEIKDFALTYLSTYSVDIYNTTEHHIFTHHVAMTRGYITQVNGRNTWFLCPSCVYSLINRTSPNYYYFAGKKSTVTDVLSKYLYRGYSLPHYLREFEHRIYDYLRTELKIPYGWMP